MIRYTAMGLIGIIVLLTGCSKSAQENVKVLDKQIIVGAAQQEVYLPLLRGKRVGLVVNQTSRVGDTHLVDYLIANDVDVKLVFAPEHGFRGNHSAGASVSDAIDPKTGIPLISIYGKNKKPDAKTMDLIDVVIFDIQDVGVRFYTYISSMHYMMEASAEHQVEFMVFDRPNPNGAFIDGPVLDLKFQSFVGMHPIPLLHGLTVGELAHMISGQGWLTTEDSLKLTVIEMLNYRHSMAYSLPIKPSPNLPNAQSIKLYPSLAFFEATPVSIGRGTDFPFQVIGHDKVAVDNNMQFMPTSRPQAAKYPKFEDKQLDGTSLATHRQGGLNLDYILAWHRAFKAKGLELFNSPKFMDKLSGTDRLRKSIEAGESAKKIRQVWQADLTAYRTMRQQYLLYTD